MTLLRDVGLVEVAGEARTTAVGDEIVRSPAGCILGNRGNLPLIERILIAAHYLTVFEKPPEDVFDSSMTKGDASIDFQAPVNGLWREGNPLLDEEVQYLLLAVLSRHNIGFGAALCSCIETVRIVAIPTGRYFGHLYCGNNHKNLSGRGTVVTPYDDCRGSTRGAGSPERAWRRPPGGGHENSMTDSTYTPAGLQARDRRTTNGHTITGSPAIDWQQVREEVGE